VGIPWILTSGETECYKEKTSMGLCYGVKKSPQDLKVQILYYEKII